jgi:hypothetical protein
MHMSWGAEALISVRQNAEDVLIATGLRAPDDWSDIF